MDVDEEEDDLYYDAPDTPVSAPMDVDPAASREVVNKEEVPGVVRQEPVRSGEPSTLQPSSTTFNERDLDLVNSVQHMYRLLDLISEQGSGGLGLYCELFDELSLTKVTILVVDKVIIAQDAMGAFINALSPGAYRDLTKVDFSAMDETRVKPMGIYGSKSEIVRFMLSLGAIDERLWVLPSSTFSTLGRN